MTCSPWVTSADAVAPCNTYDIDPVLLDQTMQMASDVLYGLTDRKYPGTCTDTIRPLASWRVSNRRPGWWAGDNYGTRSNRFGYCACNRSPDYGCGTIPEVYLPGRPVHAASVEVVVDGQTFLDFRVDDGYKLVRTDGGNWRCCQRLELDDTEDGTWSVTYNYGRTPPLGGLIAAAVLGSQLYLAVPGAPGVEDKQSLLPKRITSIVRQGITLAVIDPLKLFADGLTGIPIVDLWVASDRLSSQRRPASVLVPGRGRSVRRVG